jgi:hypothetical protein
VSRIIGPLFEGSPLLFMPLLALILFAAVFFAVVARLIWQGKAHYDTQARTPLADDERVVGRLP